MTRAYFLHKLDNYLHQGDYVFVTVRLHVKAMCGKVM